MFAFIVKLVCHAGVAAFALSLVGIALSPVLEFNFF
jgi:hypothetical protein